MRLRNIKGSNEFIADNQYVIHKPTDLKEKWHEWFQNDNPIHIEIGMGKGKFIHTLASLNPNINYIGIEKYSSVLYRALERREEYDLDNLFFLRIDANNLLDVFSKHEISRIYLNFSDPWPKERHEKRRLTSRYFLDIYDQFLTVDGTLMFKTDNRGLFDFTLFEISQSSWKMEVFTFDLHHSEYLEGNIMTEYEEKFVQQGVPINYLNAYR